MDAPFSVEHESGFLVVGFDASDVVGSGLVEGGHQEVERVPELRTHCLLQRLLTPSGWKGLHASTGQRRPENKRVFLT